MSIISQSEYLEATDQYLGWCTGCEDFTRDTTEPDAEDYHCPVCEEQTVMGAEQAMLLQEVEIAA